MGNEEPGSLPGAPADPANAPLPASFEPALAELEDLVRQMEGGELSLEASLAAYRRGAALVGVCRQSLSAVRQQVRVLEGELLRPFDPDAGLAD
jgi:exodeoxyribonuclease VII small subunit